ncbi:hypothetical protein OKW40_000140 [Paraburkholderia sp. RAU6.4a]
MHIADGAVELLLRIGKALADFPYDQIHNLMARGRHETNEVLHAADALRDCHRWPLTAAVIVGSHGRVQRGIALDLAHDRITANDDLFSVAGGLSHADWRLHVLAGAIPCLQFSIDERDALMNRLREADGIGNIVGDWKQLPEVLEVNICHLSLLCSCSTRWSARCWALLERNQYDRACPLVT